MWKFQNFSAPEILRDINIDGFRGSEIVILTISEALNFSETPKQAKLISRKIFGRKILRFPHHRILHIIILFQNYTDFT